MNQYTKLYIRLVENINIFDTSKNFSILLKKKIGTQK